MEKQIETCSEQLLNKKRGLRYYKEEGTAQQTQNTLSTDTRDRQPILATARQTEWFEFVSQRTREVLQQLK